MKTKIILPLLFYLFFYNFSVGQTNSGFKTKIFPIDRIKPNHEFYSQNIFYRDSSYEWRWDFSSASWESAFRKYYQNDWMGHLQSDLTQSFNNNLWEDSFQSFYGYDANYNLTSHYDQSWGVSGWVNSSNYTYAYDSNNQNTYNLTQWWNGMGWENSQQAYYWWNTNGSIDSVLYQTWGIAWQNEQLDIYNYNINNELVRIDNLDWNGLNWVTFSQILLFTTAPGDTTEIINQHWNGSTWENIYRVQLFFDSGSINTGLTFSNWDGVTWVEEVSKTNTYDNNNNLESELDVYFSGRDSTHYYYSDITDVPEHENLSGISVAPNPATDFINIHFENSFSGECYFELVDLSGRMVYKQNFKMTTVSELETIKINYLKQGIYFLKICSDNKYVVKKIIKQ